MRVGITLVVLMILNVVLASLKQAMPVIPAAVFLWVETILLVARAVMAVLFGHAIHALREEYGETTITVKDAGALQQQVEGLASELARVQLNVQRQFTQQVQDQMTEQVNLLNHLTGELQGVQSQVQKVIEQLPAVVEGHVSHALQNRLHPHAAPATAHLRVKGAVNHAAAGATLPDQERVNPRMSCTQPEH